MSDGFRLGQPWKEIQETGEGHMHGEAQPTSPRNRRAPLYWALAAVIVVAIAAPFVWLYAR